MIPSASGGSVRRTWLSIAAVFLAVCLLLSHLPSRAQGIVSSPRPASGRIALPVPQAVTPEIVSTPMGDLVTLSETALNVVPGEPQLPVTVLRVLLPPDALADSVRVELVDAAWADLPDRVDVRAAPPFAASDLEGTPEWGDHEADAFRDGRLIAIYEQDAFWPTHPIGAVSVGSQRGWLVLELTYWPLAYNPVQGTMRQLTAGTLQITYQSSGTAGRVLDAASEAAWASLSPSLLNPDARSVYTEGARGVEQSPDSGEPLASSVNDYVIITTAAIVANSPQLAAFVQSKQQAGHSVKVVTEGAANTSTTYVSGASAAARADNIRSWLVGRYASEGIQYVLLIGNPSTTTFDSATSVPMKMTRPSGNTATDMYYSDLSGTWDLNSNGVYGEYSDIGTGGIDRLPEVYVGRVPYYGSYAELNSILGKFVAYQAAGGDLSWRQRALIAAAISNHGPQDNNNDGVISSYPTDYSLSHRTFGADWGEEIKGIATGAGLGAYTLYEKEGVYSDGSAYPLTTASAPLNTSNMVSAWQQGYGIVTWWAHGSTSGAYRRIWAHDTTRADHITQYSQETQTTAFFTTSEVGQLNNARPSFVLQVACTNGSPESSANLGYRLLVNGAVGTVSSSQLSYYSPGSWPYYGIYGLGDNATLSYMALDRMLNYGENIGVALAYYRANTMLLGSSQYWQNMVVANLYGDPSLSLSSSGIGCSVAPPTPAQPYPANGALAVDLDTDLIWSGGPGCSGETVTYDVYMRAGSGPETLVCNDTESLGCDPGVLLESTTYSWRVVAQGIGGQTASPTWTFTTETTPCALAPEEPNDPVPADGQTGVALDTLLLWCGGHPCDGEQVTYDVYLEESTDQPTLLACAGTDEPRCDPGPLKAGTQYAWYVVAMGLNGPVIGPVWTFDTAVCAIPGAVALDAPQNEAHVEGGQPLQLRWQATEGARRYLIQIARDPSFADLVVDQQTSDTVLTLGSTVPSGTYYWRVRVAETTLGCTVAGDWSEIRSLEVEANGMRFMAFVPVTLTK